MNNMNTKIIKVCLSFLLVFSLLATNIVVGLGEAGASQKFYQSNLTTENFKSPQRTGTDNMTDVWPHINSAWNQPRSVVGSNPHQGTDLNMSVSTPVFSVVPGSVSEKGNDWILVKHGLKNLYVVYKHINPESDLTKGSPVYNNTKLGTIQNITAPHLHFGMTTNTTLTYSNLIWAANYAPFSHVTSGNWYNGRGLDFLKSHYITNGHVLNIWAYASDDANAYIQPQKVWLYHRKSGNTTWQGPLSMNKASSTGNEHRYYYNFGGLGYVNNDKVEWLVVGYRSGMTSNNWAFYPGYYATPNQSPDLNSKYFTTTLTGMPEPLNIEPLEEEITIK